MARGRAELSDKEQRILVQAQLMGLTTASMVRISNRLKALEKERDEIAVINNAIAGFSWGEIKDPIKQTTIAWQITDPDGLVCTFKNRRPVRTKLHVKNIEYDVDIIKPGTRFKPRSLKKCTVDVYKDWVSRLCPAKSKEVYAMIRWTRNIQQHLKVFE